MADNITHGLAAALLAQAGFRQRYGAAATVALVVGSEIPDLDELFETLGGPVTGFIHHRGITHSLLGGLLLALLGAAVIYSFRRPQAYWRLAGLTYLGVLLHIWMDYVTSYGTQVFLPFDAGRYTSDTLFIIDFFYSGVMITALLLARMVRRQTQQRYAVLSLVWLLLGLGLWYSAPRLAQQSLWLLALRSGGLYIAGFAAAVALIAYVGRRWQATHAVVLGRWGVAVLVLYTALCFVTHALARQQMAAALGPQMATVQRLAALPVPGGGPFVWRGIAETPSTYLVSRLTLVPPRVAVPEVVARGPDNTVVRATSAYRLVRVFHDFARFPVVDYRDTGAEKVVRYFDLRFSGNGRSRSWFDLVVRFNGADQVQEIEFLNHVFLPTHPDFH